MSNWWESTFYHPDADTSAGPPPVRLPGKVLDTNAETDNVGRVYYREPSTGALTLANRDDHTVPAPGTVAELKPTFGSDEYINSLAQKHGADPRYIRNVVEGQIGGSAIEGIPILGAGVRKAGATVSAVAGGFESAPGETFAERKAKNLEIENEVGDDFKAYAPVTHAAAGIVGGGASMLAGGELLPFGRLLLGMTGRTLPAQIVSSATSGGALNALDALARGGSAEDARTAGEIGTGLGILGPVAGKVAGGIYRGASKLVGKRSVPPTGAAGQIAPENFIKDVAGVDVPVPYGTATGDVASQRLIERARTGEFGPGPQREVEAFYSQHHEPAVEEARTNIAKKLDPSGNIYAESPQEAEQILTDRIPDIASEREQQAQDAYARVAQVPGLMDNSVFKDVGTNIRNDLRNRSAGPGVPAGQRNPVFVEQPTSPITHHALNEIDKYSDQVATQKPGGLDLQDIDQMRKHLTYRLRAINPNSDTGPSDIRAMRAAIGEFDDRVEQGMTNGLFSGQSQDALDALKTARQTYKQYADLFKGDDQVGKMINRIVTQNNGQGVNPLQLGRMIYGTSKIGQTNTAPQMVDRMKAILGDGSPEWSTLKQGMWHALTEDGGPQKVAGKLDDFLTGNGIFTAQKVFSPEERKMMGQYRDLQRQLIPKEGAVNPPGTAHFLGPIISKLGSRIAEGLGATAGGSVLPGMGGEYIGGELGGRAFEKGSEAARSKIAQGQVVRHLYHSDARTADERAFKNQMGRWGGFGSFMANQVARQAMANQQQQQNQ